MSQTTIDFSIDWAAFAAAAGADLANFSIAGGTNVPAQHTWGMLANSYIAATYPFHRGAALSSWVRASNTAGALTNVAASVDGHVLRRSGTALGYGVLAAGAFATGPGIVTFAMMDNGAARSVAGRSANSAGARADIAGAGTANAQQFLTDNGTTVAFRSPADANTIYEVNYSTLANNTFADGAEVIDGLNYVAANMAELGTAAVQNGTGIRMIVATSNGSATTMTDASQLAPYIYVPLSQIAGYDPTATYIYEIYFPSSVFEATGEGVFLGLWGPGASPYAASGARMRKATILNAAGPSRTLRAMQQATEAASDIAIPTHNVLALKVDPFGTGQVYSGVWSSGWPTLTAGPTFPTPFAGTGPFNTGDVRLFMGLATVNDASPTTAITIERLRIRKVG